MVDGLYKIIGYDEEGERFCSFYNFLINDVVYIRKLYDLYYCDICGKSSVSYAINGECERIICKNCLDHIYFNLIKKG